MSYLGAYFLTVLVTLFTIATPLSAQRDIVKDELQNLAAPSSYQRTLAISKLVEIEDDIDADLRVAYRFAENEERTALLQVARLRGENALLQAASEALSGNNESLVGEARCYLLALPRDELTPKTDEFDADARAAWDDFMQFRLRRDIAHALIHAYVKPGKFFGQFDKLRARDADRLDTELLNVVRAAQEFAEPLSMVTRAYAESDVAIETTLRAQWRNIKHAPGMLDAAMDYLRHGKLNDDINRQRRRQTDTAFRAGLAVVSGVRSAAARALANSDRGDELLTTVADAYQRTLKFTPDPQYADAIGARDLVVELEITLARLGDSMLLDARVSRLRLRIQQFDDAQVNVNLRPSSRPDLLAQNEIARLHLRAGGPEKAESEWLESVQVAKDLMRDITPRNRNALSSYLATVYYNVGCAQSLQFKRTTGLESLKKAVEYGYDDFIWMLEDGDLAYIRQSAEFIDWFIDAAPPSVGDQLRRDS